MSKYKVLITETVGKEIVIDADDKLHALSKANLGDWSDDDVVRTEITSRSVGEVERIDDYKNCVVRIYSVTYQLVDEYGDDILNEDGSVKLFLDTNGALDYSTWCEHVEADDLEEAKDQGEE